MFGVVLGGEARAYPRRMLEVHELVNDELGGEAVSLPSCTLCGAPIAYATDMRFRTSGLLQRSNKLMYDEATESLFDQLRGVAVAGQLRGLALEMAPLTVTTWRAWRQEHPATTILAADTGSGHVYDADPLGDRDARGPIFPVGERDERLPAQEQVLGVPPGHAPLALTGMPGSSCGVAGSMRRMLFVAAAGTLVLAVLGVVWFFGRSALDRVLSCAATTRAATVRSPTRSTSPPSRLPRSPSPSPSRSTATPSPASRSPPPSVET